MTHQLPSNSYWGRFCSEISPNGFNWTFLVTEAHSGGKALKVVFLWVWTMFRMWLSVRFLGRKYWSWFNSCSYLVKGRKREQTSNKASGSICCVVTLIKMQAPENKKVTLIHQIEMYCCPLGLLLTRLWQKECRLSPAAAVCFDLWEPAGISMLKEQPFGNRLNRLCDPLLFPSNERLFCPLPSICPSLAFFNAILFTS